MKPFLKKYDTALEWGLGIFAVIMPIYACWHELMEGINPGSVFPPLGVMAFGLMWTHFVMGALRRYAGIQRRPKSIYMTLSMGMVLALIILHPGLLWLKLYMEGFGLPPESYLTAYRTQLALVLLGSISLIIFLSYELKRFFGSKGWWKYVEQIQIVGMAAIFIHAIGLGRDFSEHAWFIIVWFFYGVTLAAAIIYSRLIANKAIA